jgi:exopolyphosphatase/guanosine-5'-triphosphate,3'-diphosphate pyrophosphatase
MNASTGVAAVDLGSNSFHLVIARAVLHELQLVDRLRESIQLAAGLDESSRLTDEMQERALNCLLRFGQRLRDLPRSNIRAVGTDALRRARNARSFLRRAEQALGVPIEIVSGTEEARLIYLGVAHSLHDEASRRLAIDIGGGSTECILGEGFEVLEAASLRLGSVAFTHRFFGHGTLDRERFRAAELAAHQEFQQIERTFKGLGWESCVGSSGTALSIDEMLRAQGSNDGVTLEGLKRLRKQLVAAGSITKLSIPAVRDDRLAVLPGGLAILIAFFESLGVDRLDAASGAMREGLLYDLLGRIRHEDVRDRTIRAFSERYHIDREQAARVERTALNLLTQAGRAWGIDTAVWRQRLAWAARLHETGLAVTYSGYHKHGAYLVSHSDLPGFSTDDQLILGALIQAHRRRLDREALKTAPAEDASLLRVALLLRLAVLLNRSRSPRRLPTVSLSVQTDELRLNFPPGWLDQHPLTHADLRDEAQHHALVGYKLEIS